jgi:hypothetical protein
MQNTPTPSNETARERAMKLLASNPKWQEAPKSGELFGIPASSSVTMGDWFVQELLTNPKCKEAPRNGQVSVIGGYRPRASS